ncbi:hypothetical protein EHS13_27460 [Paenibacillus psychroresistens]|uniref:GyrI-like small molecule binding domain-containing protein n=1 Tax=Paenibacillus psychroresistens TaxID=1778678 RepID=A0A6B8RSS2_9BACL|nr:GyrI-like domain-containing protein [Paenibacillus psychroresistens]QGQ98356.1 hypothetical protein EHS13_27460 [Paenibacillus psychroresistens]
MAIDRKVIEREDIRRSNKEFYSLRDKTVQLYTLPEMNYLSSTGVGERNIYAMYDYRGIWMMGRFINRVKHYTVRDLNKNFSRMPMELEWGDPFKANMWVPEYIDQILFNNTVADLVERFGEMDYTFELVMLPQRRCAQFLHQGSYEEIQQSEVELLRGIEAQGYKPKGKCQEIFMNHPHCNPPEKLKILLRHELA